MSSIELTLRVPNHSRRRMPRKREQLVPNAARALKRTRDLGWMNSSSVSSLSLEDSSATATISLRISLGSCSWRPTRFSQSVVCLSPYGMGHRESGTYGWHKRHRALVLPSYIHKRAAHTAKSRNRGIPWLWLGRSGTPVPITRG